MARLTLRLLWWRWFHGRFGIREGRDGWAWRDCEREWDVNVAAVRACERLNI